VHGTTNTDKLWTPTRHEPVTTRPWDETAALNVARDIVRNTLQRFDEERMWPRHPEDLIPSFEAGAPCFELYAGAAGVVVGLSRLAALDADIDVARFARTVYQRARSQTDSMQPSHNSYLLGIAGPALIAAAYGGESDAYDFVYQDALGAIGSTGHEIFAGSPGFIHAARFLYERTRLARWHELLERLAEDVVNSLEVYPVGTHLWTQNLYGMIWSSYLGAAHGFAGNAHAVLASRELVGTIDYVTFERKVVETAVSLAIREGKYVNWPGRYGFEPLPNRSEYEQRLQWCHGAPGFVISLDVVSSGTHSELDGLLLGAGELTWMAGPPRDDASICHGAAGNGWAFLKLYRRTRNPAWLQRARAFAMHAIETIRKRREKQDEAWFSFWTGDLGTACYLLSCVELDDRLPLIDYLP
jgi:hypothetical protein